VRRLALRLSKDPTESTDVAARYPKVVARLERLMQAQHTPSKEFPFPVLDAQAATPGSPHPALRP
jgi:hypothetical protein